MRTASGPAVAVALAAAVMAAAPARAQDGDQLRTAAPAAPSVTLPNTEVRFLSSERAGVDYELYVSVPKSYRGGDRAYPVVYMLDADYSFAIARNIVEHLSDRGDMPEMILVGIAYAGPVRYRLNRTRDYTPTHTLQGGYGPEYQRHSGGGPKLLRFMREELIPYIDAAYRTTGERTLVGHSYGGLFGSWVLFTEPSTFANYILVSPSLWYDDGLMFRIEREYAERQPVSALRAHMWSPVAYQDIFELSHPNRDRGGRGRCRLRR